jgi:hypothetical protein
MMEVHNFVAMLARAGKGQKDIKLLDDVAYGDKALSINQINRIKLLRRAKTPLISATPVRRKQSGLPTF